MGLASRGIIGHAYTREHVTSEVAIQTNLKIIRRCWFLPKIMYFHTGRGSIFTSNPYEKFMRKQNITVSRGACLGQSPCFP